MMLNFVHMFIYGIKCFRVIVHGLQIAISHSYQHGLMGTVMSSSLCDHRYVIICNLSIKFMM